jgi:hypothetical protein
MNIMNLYHNSIGGILPRQSGILRIEVLQHVAPERHRFVRILSAQ